jgi:hypothetical protein
MLASDRVILDFRWAHTVFWQERVFVCSLLVGRI